MEAYTIQGERLRATILAHGAELSSVHHAVAGEMLWGAGPAWPKHAPTLFPIVGELANDTLRHEGKTYSMSRHGFARNREFALAGADAESCTLVLVDDDATRAQYPFAFALEIRYAIDDDALAITSTIRNPGDVTLPASIGAHPAFRWPLAAGIEKTAHVLTFDRDEPEPIRRLTNNLLDPRAFPSPIRGRELALDPSLFDDDAIVMDRIRSTSLRYSAPGAPSLEISWSGYSELGLWSKPGGDFLCIEPWRGYASPVGFDGDFAEKPGLVQIAPGASAVFEFRVHVIRCGDGDSSPTR